MFKAFSTAILLSPISIYTAFTLSFTAKLFLTGSTAFALSSLYYSVHEPCSSIQKTSSTTLDRFCGTCNIYKRTKTHHCTKCRVCWTAMNHHCDYLGVCIGSNNMRYFISFLVGLLGLFMIVLFIVIEEMLSVWSEFERKSNGWQVFVGMTNSIILLPLSLLLTMLLYNTIEMVCCGIDAVDKLEMESLPEWRFTRLVQVFRRS